MYRNELREIEQDDKYRYLGCMLIEDWRNHTEIKTRITIGK